MTREEKRQQVREYAEQWGLKIDESQGGYRITGRNGFIDFRVMDLADVLLADLTPQRWA